MILTGVGYYRRLRHITKAELYRRCKASPYMIPVWDHDPNSLEHLSVSRMLTLADALGVTIDQLLEIHDDAELGDKHYPIRNANDAPESNCIGNYRALYGVKYEELARRMNMKSREHARQACKREVAIDKHVKAIADYEKMTAEQFREIYKDRGDCCEL